MTNGNLDPLLPRHAYGLTFPARTWPARSSKGGVVKAAWRTRRADGCILRLPSSSSIKVRQQRASPASLGTVVVLQGRGRANTDLRPRRGQCELPSVTSVTSSQHVAAVEAKVRPWLPRLRSLVCATILMYMYKLASYLYSLVISAGRGVRAAWKESPTTSFLGISRRIIENCKDRKKSSYASISKQLFPEKQRGR
ncbi:hypothetical protein E2C01_032197 [Portunus trituberculatus]|uniref:Uncharacterized protein n=1 Tax=Portunus trituberculatus TaxID=210409 RepID=A0A5B7EZY9_PORTR|nr:hypothetical protein [Portunus trituberculatus]